MHGQYQQIQLEQHYKQDRWLPLPANTCLLAWSLLVQQSCRKGLVVCRRLLKQQQQHLLSDVQQFLLLK